VATLTPGLRALLASRSDPETAALAVEDLVERAPEVDRSLARRVWVAGFDPQRSAAVRSIILEGLASVSFVPGWASQRLAAQVTRGSDPLLMFWSLYLFQIVGKRRDRFQVLDGVARLRSDERAFAPMVDFPDWMLQREARWVLSKFYAIGGEQGMPTDSRYSDAEWRVLCLSVRGASIRSRDLLRRTRHRIPPKPTPSG